MQIPLPQTGMFFSLDNVECVYVNVWKVFALIV